MNNAKRFAVFALTILAALASPLLAKGGRPVNVMEKIRLGGLDQTVLIRGEDSTNPIILFLHGGPGYPEMPYLSLYQKRLEKHFVVVQWDQRGAGQSYSASIPTDTMRIEQFVSDIHDLAWHLRERFGHKKIVLVGHSWGSIIGSFAAQKYPYLFAAYVGLGQATNVVESEKKSFDYVMQTAKLVNNEKAVQELSNIGQPPAYGFNLANINTQRKWLSKFGGMFYARSNDQKCTETWLSSQEYKTVSRSQVNQGIQFSMQTLAPEILGVNLFEQVPELKIPAYYLVGRSDYVTSFELVEKYYRQLKAPKKELVWFEKSGHNPHLEESKKFADFLISRFRFIDSAPNVN